MNLTGKTILITGASDGLGKQIALKLAKEKVNLLLLSRNEAKLKEVLQQIKNLGAPQSDYFVCDLKNKDNITQVVEKINETHTHLHGLINNAGVWQKVDQLDNLSDEEIIEVFQTNLLGLTLLTKKLLPLIRKSPQAAIINISSRSGHSAQAGQSVYTASKYGVRGFTEVLREDLKDSTIRVAGVYQGGTNTKMFEKAGEDWPSERYASFIPAEGLAEVIVFMLSRPNKVWLPEVRVESK